MNISFNCKHHKIHLLLGLFSFINFPIFAQSTLSELLQKVEKNYPAIQAKKYQSQAAEEGINLPKKDNIPSLDAAYQLNYGTFNNITGMATPLAWVPVSGPPSADNQFGGTLGSSLGALANWQPITFGQRKSAIANAQNQYNLALADEKNVLYLQQAKVISAYLDYMLSQSLVAVYEDNVSRLNTQLTQVRTLTNTGLRPGVDTAIVKAELSKAKTELLQAKNEVQIRLIQLSELTAEKSLTLPYDSTFFTKNPSSVAEISGQANPILDLNKQQISLLRSQKDIFKKSWYPKLNFWGTLYARGSGIDYLGNVETLNGLGFSRFNYGFGAQLSMPLLHFSKINVQVLQQDFRIQAAQSQLAQTEWQLSKEMETANAHFQNASSIAAEMPLQVASAEYAFEAMQSRYGAGLVNYTDLLQVQYNLLKAETENKKANYDVWKALLYQATVAGDLEIFLEQY